jgi:hypothetical protein
MPRNRFDDKWEPDDSFNRTPFVQRLLSAPNLPAFITDLITTQATTVAGTEGAGFLIERGTEGVELRLLGHIRPGQSTKEIREAAIKAFIDLIKPCVAEGKDGAIELSMPSDSDETDTQYCLVTLLRSDGKAIAASAIISRCRDINQAKLRLQSMQLLAGYFELFTVRHNSEQARSISLNDQHVLQLLTITAQANGFDSAAMNLCNELANRTGASRVSLGSVKGSRIQIEALSRPEYSDKTENLIVALRRVMRECADQKESVRHDPSGECSQNVSHEAAALSRSQGGNIVLSIPLQNRAEICNVVTLEFFPNTRISQDLISGLATALQLLGPHLYNQYENDRRSGFRVGSGARELLSWLRDPGHPLAKVVMLLIIAALVYVFFHRPWSL